MRILTALAMLAASFTSAFAEPSLSKDELAVLRQHFAPDAKAGTPVILDGKSSIGIREPGRDWKTRLRRTGAKHNVEVQQAIEDFIAKNESDSVLEDLKLDGVKLTVVSDAEAHAIFASKDEDGWDLFRRRFSCSTLHSISRVGFSKDGTLAVYFAYSQHGWSTGEGHFRVMRKRDKDWSEDASISVGWQVMS